jgi:uncharacterized protein
VRVLFDTNVLYSAFTSKGFCEDVVDQAAGTCHLVWSDALRAEFEGVLKRRGDMTATAAAALAAFAGLCEFHTPVRLEQAVCRDPDDDVVLGTAVAAKADVIVTGDDDLLVLRRYRGSRILSPRRFLEFLDRR